jgi:hypothetical protein
MNARCHGLATRLSDIPDQLGKLEQLTVILAQGCSNWSVVEEARVVAECHLDLQRIRTVRYGSFQDVMEAETVDELKSALSKIAKVDRYACRSVSKRKTALKKLVQE